MAPIEQAETNVEQDGAVSSGLASDVPADASAAAVTPKKAFKITIELLVAILLALTALCTAWASWMSELHQSTQAEKYALSSALYSSGGAQINYSAIQVSSMAQTWVVLVSLQSEKKVAEAKGDTETATNAQAQIDYYIDVMFEPEDKADIYAALESNPTQNVFDEAGIIEAFKEPNAILDQAKEAINAGNASNLYSDSYGLVRVLYSIVLFLAAAIGIYKEPLPRKIMLTVGCVFFVFATIYMVSLPLPDGFSFDTYLNVAK